MESILIIANVTTEDYNGAFVCYAVNNIGSTYKRVVRLYAPCKLIVRTAPHYAFLYYSMDQTAVGLHGKTKHATQ